MTGVYPGSPAGFMIVVGSYMSYNKYNQLDPSMGFVVKLGQYIPIRWASLTISYCPCVVHFLLTLCKSVEMGQQESYFLS